ncbi:MAG: DUF5107 domain-containing protein [Clostridia bacterium]|nr:DUF5107 domain-containing protein [Clostridia bacterium]
MLKFTEMRIPAANLGTPNVLPDVKADYTYPVPSLNAVPDPAANLRPDESAWVHKGRIHCMLPYTMQDGYDRKLTEKPLKTAVLENEYLRAEFSTELGGRLWSLISKPEDRELLFRNNVFQPANLALRNAWFSGGIEWNIGMIGHHPFTCSPLFIARYRNAAGGETLKMYEYERKRGIVYTVQATLAKDNLLVRVTIENLSGKDTYVYWWSNGAYLETPDSRVIVPATTYYNYPWRDGKPMVEVPEVPKDAYYPANHDHAYDYFYRMEENRHRFMSYYNGEGKGFVQFSTDTELGRKLFVWGTQKAGGRNWNRWLSHDDRYYAELQAGLLHSQSEQRPMKAGEIIEWTEGYAASSGDPAILHGEDYGAANHYVEDQIVNDGRIALVCDSDAYFTPAEAEEILSYGSGWGALEELARKKAGLENWRLSNLSVFPVESAKGKPEEDFLTLLETGKLPARSAKLTEDTVLEYCAGGRFIKALELVEDKDWYTWLQLGCAYYEAKTFDAARMAFEKSVKAEENAIALRTLAWIYASDAERRGEKCREAGVKCMMRAVELGGTDYVRLIIDAIRYMQKFGTDEDIVALIESCGDTYKTNGRVALFYARSLTRIGRLDDAAAIMNSKPEVSDIQEGEVSTSAIWLDLYRKIIARDEQRDGADIADAEIFEKYPIPQEIDFRMS